MRTSVRLRQIALISVVASLAPLACRASTRDPQPRSAKAAAPPPLEIPPAAIERARGRAKTALDLIRLLRPSMLTLRDARVTPPRSQVPFVEPSELSVYVDGLHVGGLRALTLVPARSVLTIHRLPAATAGPQYGAALPGGVIVITTVSRDPRF